MKTKQELQTQVSVSELERESALNEEIIRAGRRAASKLLCDRTALVEAVEHAELLLSGFWTSSYIDHLPENARADVFQLQRKLNKVLREHGGSEALANGQTPGV